MSDETVLERILKGDEEPRDLPLALIQDITNDFSEENKIGQGGFGKVYKGELRRGIFVAVKRIEVNQITIDDVSFRREFNSLMNTNHQNIVRFLGFCSNTHHIPRKEAGEINLVNVRERILCFEYIGSGSLDKHITDELRGLEWEPRYEIITGICKGLHYLHKEKNIIHMDLKPANILLDDHKVPKITDFGLSRSNEKSHTIGLRFGTAVYVAPEYEKYGKTSFMCDIYSLGVIITELATGCKAVPDKNNVLRRWRHRWNKPPTLLQYHQVTSCIKIAVHCREQKPEARPSIGDILSILSEFGSMDGHTGQESTYLDDDMLGIEPLELQFASKIDTEMSCSVKLTNKTKACFAFNIENPSKKQYTIRPYKGIVTPECNEYLIQITVQLQEMVCQNKQNAEKFIVQSTKVSEGLRVEDITQHIFHQKDGKVVDEVNVMVTYETGSRKRGQDTNVQVLAVLPKHKAIKSCSYEDGKRGQCPRQQDRHNFHPPENFSHRQPTNKTYLPRVSDRAMDVTRGAMGSLLHKLGELLKGEFNLDATIKEDIKSVSKELMKMQEVLHKMSEVQQDNLHVMVKHWASNVREMSYDLEDFVDGFLVHKEPDSGMSSFKELTHDMCLLLEKGQSHQQIGNLIKQHMCKQVQDEDKNHKEYNVDNLVANAAAAVTKNIDPRMFVQFQRPRQLVGIQEQRDDLIKKLSQVSEQELGIFSIYGCGGLGKTTLAKTVYDKLKGQFHPMAFVSVGQKPNEMKVFRDIVAELTNDYNTETVNDKQLIKKLHILLKNKRYFIVIDDIWESSAWGIIERAFPECNLGSRVVITTRIHSVANVACCDINCVYKMTALNDRDSRKLFLSRIFGMQDACPDVPEDILSVILKKCGGLPLAVISIASIVAKDPTKKSTWDYVRKSLIDMFKGDNPILSDMERILDHSYRHLPNHLKTCLLHVCMYPEDREIDKNDLLIQWVAEGFVVSTNGRLDVEDVAEEYFKELINMCMIQPERIDDYSNEVLSCSVHDIILDLMRTKSSEENFSHITDGSETWAHGEIRRISVHRRDSEVFERIKGSLSHARSALFCQVSPILYLVELRYVRVLHIEYSGMGNVLDFSGITRLFLLRYLKIDLRFYNKLKLPDQIGELQYLETMDLKFCNVENYPSDIVCLPWLSHLIYRDWPAVSLPDGVEKLKYLRTLEGVHMSGHTSSVENIKGLGKLAKLRRLHILLSASHEWEDAMCMDALHSSISNISSSLRILTLGEDVSSFRGDIVDVPRGWSSMTLFPDGSAIRELDLRGCRFERCPGWISQLRNLHKFSVRVREVADGLNLVSGLSSLGFFYMEIFCVKLEQKEESIVIPGGGAFKALKNLNFFCPKAVLTFEPGALPKLEKLHIRFRYEMTPQLLPVGIQHLPAPTLKAIRLVLDEGYMEDKVKGSEDWDDYKRKRYLDSDKYRNKETKHRRNLKAMLQKAFKHHHPRADIDVCFVGAALVLTCFRMCYFSDEEHSEEDDNKEQDDEEFYFSEEECEIVDDEEHYSTEEDDEAAYELRRSQTSAQVHADHTRQLIELIEVRRDSSGINVTTDIAPAPVVDMSLRLAVGEGWQSGQGEGFSFSEYDDKREDCCHDEYGEAAHQVNESQTSAQVRADTRQLLPLIEEQKVSATLGIEETEVPLILNAHTSLHLAVGSEGQQVGYGEGFAVLESLQPSSTRQPL